MLEIVASNSKQGTPASLWQAGFIRVDELQRFVDQSNLRRWAWSNPTLIIIDDASEKTTLIHRLLSSLNELAQQECVCDEDEAVLRGASTSLPPLLSLFLS